MGLILSEPIKKVVEILKILTKMSVEDAKIHPKRPYFCYASLSPALGTISCKLDTGNLSLHSIPF